MCARKVTHHPEHFAAGGVFISVLNPQCDYNPRNLYLQQKLDFVTFTAAYCQILAHGGGKMLSQRVLVLDHRAVPLNQGRDEH